MCAACRRSWIALVIVGLIGTACSESSKGQAQGQAAKAPESIIPSAAASPDTCEKRVQALVDRQAAIEEDEYNLVQLKEGWPVYAEFLPEIESGWESVTELSLVVDLTEPGSVQLRTAPDLQRERLVHGSRALRATLAEKAPAAGRVTIVAGRATPVAAIADIVASVPTAIPVALAVQKPPEVVLEEHLRLVPNTPPSLRQPMLDALRKAGNRILTPGYYLARELSAHERCPEVETVFDAHRAGGGVLGTYPVLIEVTRRCRCNFDVDGVEAGLMWAVAPYEDAARLPLPPLTNSLWRQVKDGTAQDLASAVAGQKPETAAPSSDRP